MAGREVKWCGVDKFELVSTLLVLDSCLRWPRCDRIKEELGAQKAFMLVLLAERKRCEVE